LGTALYSSSSQIAIRMISPNKVEDLPSLVRKRIQAAISYREQVVRESDAYRVIFSEADFLPGLIVDRYNDVLSFQVLTQAMDSEPLRQAILSELGERLKPASIVERVDPRVRELEQLPPRASGLVHGEKANTVFSMNGVRFHFDALLGQKTGAFLDQRENYAAAQRYARGEALDVFCYQGGFALHLAQQCSNVTGVDSSRSALEVAERNAALNGHEVEWIEANAFDLLRDYADAGRPYDTIVLDPPAFARSKRNLDTAMRGYKELNLRALKMLRPGGVLITCSCSYHVSEADFAEMLSEAASDLRRPLRVVERRGQSPDHPVLLGVPETAYLKCFILC
jgi:23S rRNA (cytosine1962-C5)-methyltransferase